MEYKRINDRLREYWQELAGTRVMPLEKEIDPNALDDIWGHCFVVHVMGPQKYKYVYLGDELIDAYGDDVTGYDVCETLVGEVESPFMEEFADILDKQHPIESQDSFTNAENLEIKYRLCLVPLGNDMGDVTHILGGLKWKAN
jgi:hypothetical protein